MLGDHLEIDFKDIYDVTKVATQGRPDLDQWVTSYTIHFSIIDGDWQDYFEDGQIKV